VFNLEQKLGRNKNKKKDFRTEKQTDRQPRKRKER
jgi:hypothetical protein